MGRKLVVALIALGSLAAEAVVAAPIPETRSDQKDAARRNLPVEGVITSPDWLSKPTGEEIASFYPPFPLALNFQGRATIHCSVTIKGELANCAVVSEEPKGLRFGQAALKLASHFRMRPMTVDGAPVGGGVINIPIGFRLPASPPPASDSAAAAPSPSPRALQLARRIAAISTAQFGVAWAATVDKWKDYLSDLSPEEQAALDAFKQSITAQLPQAVEGYAKIYARTYTEQELADVAAFYESASGRAWLSRQKETGKAMQAETARVQAAITADSLARFCQKTACPTIAGPSPVANK